MPSRQLHIENPSMVRFVTTVSFLVPEDVAESDADEAHHMKEDLGQDPSRSDIHVIVDKRVVQSD